MNILVTGGLGFIGSNFIKHRWEVYDDSVINVDIQTYAGNRDNLPPPIVNAYSWEKVCITDTDAITNIMRNNDIDVVVHFAAESHVDRSIEDSDVFIQTNVVGTHNMIECFTKHAKSGARFVHVSTDEVYGDLQEDEPAFTESSQIKPSSPYAASKASSDLLALSYQRTYGINLCVTRCSNNYGPNQHTEKLIPNMITKALAGEPLPVYGDGRNIRDWVHVQDHCEAISAVIASGVSGNVYNIGGEHELRNIEIVETILKKLKKSNRMIDYVEDRKGHDWRYAMNIDKIKSHLGWSPRVDFDTGISELIRSYK